MSPSEIRAKVIAERTAWIRKRLSGIRALPLGSLEAFRSDPRNAAAAESYLRRALESLLDLGRHIVAKGFGRPAAEYRDVGPILSDLEVLERDVSVLLVQLAGYRT